MSADAIATARRSAGSIAVLPFVNIGPDEDNESFVDGLTEDPINHAIGRSSHLRHCAADRRGSARDPMVRQVRARSDRCAPVQDDICGNVARALEVELLELDPVSPVLYGIAGTETLDALVPAATACAPADFIASLLPAACGRHSRCSRDDRCAVEDVKKAVKSPA